MVSALSLLIAQGSPVAYSRVVQDTNNSEFPNKICRVIVKGVCGKVLSREECLKLLKSKFTVQARNLTSLTYSSSSYKVSSEQVCISAREC